MEPLEIRIALLRKYGRGVQTYLARYCQVSATMIGRVIDRRSSSDRVQRAIAACIERPPSEVFPEYYRRHDPEEQ